MELVKLKIADLKPYKNNPRYNDEAVDAVEESIRQAGYIAPIIVDENNEILAGHTRAKALYRMGETEVDCIVVTSLTEEQKRKFRLLDNKTAEIADWDLEKLMVELENLDFGNFDFFSKEIEKMADAAVKGHKEQKEKMVVCPRCGKVIVGGVHVEDYEV